MPNVANHHVHFDLPNGGDRSSYPPTSNTGNRLQRFNSGFEKPPTNLTSDIEPQMPTAHPKFNFGFEVRRQSPAAVHLPDTPDHTAAMGPPPQKFNFGFAAHKQGPAVVDSVLTPPSLAPTFKFGWTRPLPPQQPAVPAAQPFSPVAVNSEPTPPTQAPTPFNFGFTKSLSTVKPAALAAQPFNFGMDLETDTPSSLISPLPVRNTRSSSSNDPDNAMQASVIPLKRAASPPSPPSTHSTAPVAEHTPKFNFGWQPRPSPTTGALQRITTIEAFQFGCKVPPAKVGDWTPAPLTAANPEAPLPSQPVTYTPKNLPNLEGAFPIPKRRKLDPAGEVMRHESIGIIIGDAEKAAVAIVKQLNGDEFDRLTQTMLGSLIKPGNEVRDPTAEEVLESNCAVLSAFCESRDRLTRIFKDLITLHHASEHHVRQLSFMDSLSKELETAEATADSQ
ncbi:hypothetical protein C8R48DRAFT_782396 [Suillus tomentosus]|nr:hypothetical protein C8R48DRAFT_782396 [Suillus tomentosus]